MTDTVSALTIELLFSFASITFKTGGAVNFALRKVAEKINIQKKLFNN